MDEDQYEMLYCDEVRCRVNTFERGVPEDHRRGSGRCPGCGSAGLPVVAP